MLIKRKELGETSKEKLNLIKSFKIVERFLKVFLYSFSSRSMLYRRKYKVSMKMYRNFTSHFHFVILCSDAYDST